MQRKEINSLNVELARRLKLKERVDAINLS
jgi:hypothetical protein